MRPSIDSKRGEDVEMVVLASQVTDQGPSIHPTQSDAESETRRNESELAPYDRGFGAWSFLLGAFIVEAVSWAWPAAYGIFLAEYLQDPAFTSQKNASSLLPLIGNLCSGLMHFTGIVLFPWLARYPHHRRPVLWLGLILCWASLFASSYTEDIRILLALEGVLYAVGGSLLWYPVMCFSSEWFVNRRGLANGVIFAGTGIGGVLLPLVLPVLIRRFGLPGSLRVLSIVVLVLVCPVLPFLKPRLPVQRVHGPAPRSQDRAWLRNRLFWLIMLVNVAHSFGYFVPLIWLPTFATALPLSASKAALCLALLNGAGTGGRILLGALADRVDAWLLVAGTMLAVAVATFVLWGALASSIAGLYAFSIVFGVVGSAFPCQWSGFIKGWCKDDPTLYTTLFGLMQLGRGLGNVLSTPVSTSMYNHPVHNATRVGAKVRTGFEVAGGRFEGMIVFAGTCFGAAALACVGGWAAERARRR